MLFKKKFFLFINKILIEMNFDISQKIEFFHREDNFLDKHINKVMKISKITEYIYYMLVTCIKRKRIITNSNYSNNN